MCEEVCCSAGCRESVPANWIATSYPCYQGVDEELTEHVLCWDCIVFYGQGYTVQTESPPYCPRCAAAECPWCRTPHLRRPSFASQRMWARRRRWSEDTLTVAAPAGSRERAHATVAGATPAAAATAVAAAIATGIVAVAAAAADAATAAAAAAAAEFDATGARYTG